MTDARIVFSQSHGATCAPPEEDRRNQNDETTEHTDHTENDNHETHPPSLKVATEDRLTTRKTVIVIKA